MRHQRFAGSLLIGVSVGLLACGGNAETQAAPEEMQVADLPYGRVLAQAGNFARRCPSPCQPPIRNSCYLREWPRGTLLWGTVSERPRGHG
ncbi:MAG: hypothetical protein CM1200mP14_19800 [Gammaproteobacteria bacterium]|nr:MAG: hypothetical protein CM1200mP14_19800 [Gammaproteobacteria bacterium]